MSGPTPLLDTLEKLLEIQEAYCVRETSADELQQWVSDCIFNSIYEDSPARKNKINYNNCSIEFLYNCLLFSVIKNETDDGFFTGVSYDIAISLKPYLYDFFGTDRIPVLKAAVSLLAEDIEEISSKLAGDIHDWSENVALVFSGLGHTN